MTDTVLTNAIAFPHDEGLPSIPGGQETWHSAAYHMALGATIESESYIRNPNEIAFANHNGVDDTVELSPGIAFLQFDATETLMVQSTRGGDEPPLYDSELPTPTSIMVVLPTHEGPLSLTAATQNDVWLAYATDTSITGVSPGDVWVRHGSGLTAPTQHPHVRVGGVNPDNASADTLPNRHPHTTLSGLDLHDTGSDPTTPGLVNNGGDLKAYTGAGVKSLSDIASGGDDDHADWNMVNVVADGGADNTGATDAVAAINSVIANNTLVVFPPGTYLCDSGNIDFTTHDRLAFWAPGGATMKVTSSNSGGIFIGSTTTPVGRGYLEGFTFDFTGVGAGARAIGLDVRKYGLVRNCNIVGEDDAGSIGPIRVNVTDPDGIARIEGWHAPDGAQHAINTAGTTDPTGFRIGSSNRGTILIDGAHIANYPDNGIYASSSAVEGTVIVRGGYFANNNISQVRLSTEGSQVIGATCLMNAAKVDDTNMRGIWLRQAEALQVENCRVIMGTSMASAGIQVNDDCPAASIRGGRVQNDVNGAMSLFVQAPAVGTTTQTTVADGVTFTGTGTGDGSHQYAVYLQRDRCVMRDCYMQMQPAGLVPRYGVRCVGNGTRIIGGSYTTDERDIYGTGNRVILDNVETNAGTNSIRIEGADWDLRAMTDDDWSNVHVGNAVRPRWEGVIEGGPFAGVNLATTTGQYQGDQAVSDGSTPTTSAGDLVHWNNVSGAWEATRNVVVEGTVALASGTATVSTGVTTTGTHFDVYLDPSGGGANLANVKCAARAFWDNTAGEYKIEILEDGTSVGNPTIGYVVVAA